MCTLARRYASYRESIHWVAHGCIMVLTKGRQKFFSCLLAALAGETRMICTSGRKRCIKAQVGINQIILAK
jgi:hypothetical protein